MDNFESIAVALSSVSNFDEVYVVVDRTNGRMIERMSLRLGGPSCSGGEAELVEQIFMDSAVTINYGQSGITQISLGIDNVYIITSPNHGFSEGDIVRLGYIANFPFLSNRYFVIYNVTTDTFYLGDEVFL